MEQFPSARSFRKWLESHHPEDVIASKWGCSNCPLTAWLHARLGQPVHIAPDWVHRDGTGRGSWHVGDGPERPLPDWAEMFADRAGHRPLENDQHAPITAAECLRILD